MDSSAASLVPFSQRSFEHSRLIPCANDPISNEVSVGALFRLNGTSQIAPEVRFQGRTQHEFETINRNQRRVPRSP